MNMKGEIVVFTPNCAPFYLTQMITLDNSPKYSSFFSPYGYLGQLVLLYILVNLLLFLSVLYNVGYK